MPPIHVTFSCSACGSLKMALRLLGRDEPVTFLDDDLSVGPIHDTTSRARLRWLADVLELDEVWLVAEHARRVWDRIAHADVIVWTNSRCASEYAGLLELVWRVPEARVHVIDAAPIAQSFAYVRHEIIVEQRLIEQAVAADRDRYLAEWQRLRDENAELRLMTESGLVSGQLSHFDPVIAGCITERWQRFMRVVGESLNRTAGGRFRQCGTDLLVARVYGMIDRNAIESRGDGSPRGTSVRLRPRPSVLGA